MEKSKTFGKWASKLKLEKRGTVLFVIGLAGIALIFLSTLTGQQKSGSSSPPAVSMPSAAAYQADMEERVRQIVAGISGDRAPDILVTLSSGYQYIYASDTKKTDNTTTASSGVTQKQSDDQQTHVILNAGGNGSALPITELPPTVRGVVIVCRGGGNDRTRQDIVEAVTVALGIPSTNVCVAESAE